MHLSSLRPLSKTFPQLAPPIIATKRAWKKLTTAHSLFELQRADSTYTYTRIFKHKSLLRRHLGDSDPHLQEQKIINLHQAVPLFDSLVIAPGKIFSFWKILGQPSAERGFVPGMLLSNGEVTTGIGGGLCQLANLFYWMFLHSPLQVIEHHHHQLDIFPDSGRILPFGSGASVFYNYVDLQVINPTSHTIKIKVYLDDTFLHGELWLEQEWPYAYRVEQRNHRFYKEPNTQQIFRANELYQVTIDKKTGHTLQEQLITKNNSRVLYEIADHLVASGAS